MSHINLNIHDVTKLHIKSRPYMSSDDKTMHYDYLQLTITDSNDERTTIDLYGERMNELVALSSNCRITFEEK